MLESHTEANFSFGHVQNSVYSFWAFVDSLSMLFLQKYIHRSGIT